ncbi:MAG: hypothetical protein RJB26_315 [Pseudomonadota bacterium]
MTDRADETRTDNTIRGAQVCAIEADFERHLRHPKRAAAAQWRATLGAPLYRELKALAKTLGTPSPLQPTSETVLIVPGFMGSTLAAAGEPALWFNPIAIAAGRLPALRLPQSAGLVPTGVMPFVYLRLRWRLRAAGYRVLYWPFDWRQAPARNAARLLQELSQRTGAPVHVVAHSQGGLVAAKALQADTAGRWLGRVVTLGTPFLGTAAAQQALAGEAPLLQRLAWLDPHHTARELAERPLATWPGLKALLPQHADFAGNLKSNDPRLACLAATGRSTPTVDAAGKTTATLEGDGTVTLASALAPTAHGCASVTLPLGLGGHGSLPLLAAVAKQVGHFFRHGSFGQATAHRRHSPPHEAPTASATYGWPGLEREAQWRFLAEWIAPVDGPPPALQPAPAVKHEVHRGVPWRRDAAVVVVGVFRHVAPAGLVRALGMQASATRAITRGGFFPEVGATERLYGRHARPDILLCGLGEFDRLDAARVTAATAAAVGQALQQGHQRIAMGLLGTTAGLGAAVAFAAQQAGIRLACARHETTHGIPHLPTIVWLCRRTQRATWLRRQLGLPRVRKEEPATLLMPPAAPSRATNEPLPLPDYLLVRQEQEARRTVLRAALLPGRSKAALLAGSRVLEPKAQTKVLAPLADGAGMAGVAAAGRALAALLPTEIATALATPREWPLVVVHDTAASLWPWETLQFGTAPHRPALNPGMARHLEAPGLETSRWNTTRPLDSAVNVLLVMNPTQDLAGAADEGQRLQTLWADDTRVQLTVLAGREATRTRILSALRRGEFDVVHYAGHAMFDEVNPAESGLVCARREVLRGADLATLSTPPYLMLANACESGRVRGPAQRLRQAALTTSLAEAFLRAGIAHYIGTWWPVADGPAATFATRFHTRLLQGATLGAAVLAARTAVHQQGSGDWADYLHYGDPQADVFKAYRRRVSNLNSARQPSRTEMPRRSKVQVSP